MHGCGLVHSYGLNRATMNSVALTRTYAATTYNQMSTASGLIKENNLVGALVGIFNSIPIPRFIKGLVKSITFSRA